MNTHMYLKKSILAAINAGEAILEVYRTEFAVDYKKDHSPLTMADRAAHQIIVDHLKPFQIPILSEEGRHLPHAKRKVWTDLWIVDPLDGTKEFIKKNGEFTVNIALVRKNVPEMGVVYAPDREMLYFAAQDLGAFKVAGSQPIQALGKKVVRDSVSMEEILSTAARLPLNDATDRSYTIVGSRSHATPELERFVEDKRREHGTVDFRPAGSALKICLVAEGRADIYPRLGPTMEWDTAAGHVVAEKAGARIYTYPNAEPLVYNKAELLNPWFVVER